MLVYLDADYTYSVVPENKDPSGGYLWADLFGFGKSYLQLGPPQDEPEMRMTVTEDVHFTPAKYAPELNGDFTPATYAPGLGQDDDDGNSTIGSGPESVSPSANGASAAMSSVVLPNSPAVFSVAVVSAGSMPLVCPNLEGGFGVGNISPSPPFCIPDPAGGSTLGVTGSFENSLRDTGCDIFRAAVQLQHQPGFEWNVASCPISHFPLSFELLTLCPVQIHVPHD
jgi:hypothetical protein